MQTSARSPNWWSLRLTVSGNRDVEVGLEDTTRFFSLVMIDSSGASSSANATIFGVMRRIGFVTSTGLVTGSPGCPSPPS